MISFLSPKYSADSMPKNHLFGLCNQFLSNSMSIVFNFRAGFGDVQSIIVKIAHAKRKKKTLVPWMMKKLSKDERKILDRDTDIKVFNYYATFSLANRIIFSLCCELLIKTTDTVAVHTAQDIGRRPTTLTPPTCILMPFQI